MKGNLARAARSAERNGIADRLAERAAAGPAKSVGPLFALPATAGQTYWSRARPLTLPGIILRCAPVKYAPALPCRRTAPRGVSHHSIEEIGSWRNGTISKLIARQPPSVEPATASPQWTELLRRQHRLAEHAVPRVASWPANLRSTQLSSFRSQSPDRPASRDDAGYTDLNDRLVAVNESRSAARPAARR